MAYLSAYTDILAHMRARTGNIVYVSAKDILAHMTAQV